LALHVMLLIYVHYIVISELFFNKKTENNNNIWANDDLYALTNL